MRKPMPSVWRKRAMSAAVVKREREGKTAVEIATATRPRGNWISVVAFCIQAMLCSPVRDARFRSMAMPTWLIISPKTTGR